MALFRFKALPAGSGVRPLVDREPLVSILVQLVQRDAVEPSDCPGLGGEQLTEVPYMNLLGEYGNLTTHANCMALMKQSLEAGGAGGAARIVRVASDPR